jgi:hypothetical protein
MKLTSDECWMKFMQLTGGGKVRASYSSEHACFAVHVFDENYKGFTELLDPKGYPSETTIARITLLLG